MKLEIKIMRTEMFYLDYDKVTRSNFGLIGQLQRSLRQMWRARRDSNPRPSGSKLSAFFASARFIRLLNTVRPLLLAYCIQQMRTQLREKYERYFY